jgi:hypothetical protein
MKNEKKTLAKSAILANGISPRNQQNNQNRYQSPKINLNTPQSRFNRPKKEKVQRYGYASDLPGDVLLETLESILSPRVPSFNHGFLDSFDHLVAVHRQRLQSNSDID